MKPRIVLCLLVFFLVLAALPSCAGREQEPDTVYGTYARPNANGLDSFTVTLMEDGTYWYYATSISSHLGHGNYTLEGDVVTLTDTQIPGVSGSLTHTYCFSYTNGTLVYLAESSDQFMYVNLPDGAVFERVEGLEEITLGQ